MTCKCSVNILSMVHSFQYNYLINLIIVNLCHLANSIYKQRAHLNVQLRQKHLNFVINILNFNFLTSYFLIESVVVTDCFNIAKDCFVLYQAFNGLSDIAIGHISMTLERLRIVDFTRAIYQMEYGMLSRKPARLGRYRVFKGR